MFAGLETGFYTRGVKILLINSETFHMYGMLMVAQVEIGIVPAHRPAVWGYDVLK